MRSVVRYLIKWAAVASAAVLFGHPPEPPSASSTVEKAYIGLINSWEYPKFQNSADQNLIEVLRRHPEETVKLLTSLIVKGQTEENKKRSGGILWALGPLGLQVLRKANETYDPEEPGNPARDGLISGGQPRDMEQFKLAITCSPNSEFAAALSSYMASSFNIHAQIALFELRDKVPGKWQQGNEVKELFSRGFLMDVVSGGRVPLPAQFANPAGGSK